jgi:predicted nucleotidyltransferase
MYGLKPHMIAAIQKVLAQHPEIDRAILYGSRAMGNYRKGSDIDLTLQGSHLTLTLLHKIEDELDDLLLPYKMDVSIIHHISNPDLLEHIGRVGVIFWERADAAGIGAELPTKGGNWSGKPGADR